MTFDSVVIGAGVEGSAAAYQLAKQKYHTLLLEQFPLPHSRGSSHGQSRIIRCAYQQTYFAHMVLDAMQMWKQLEKETNTQIFKQTGLLVGESGPTFDNYNNFLQAIQSVKKPYEKLTGSELNRKFRGALKYEGHYKGYIEEGAGLLKADKAMKCFQDQFKKFGGTLHDEEPVLGVIPGDIITVITNKGQYRTKRLVLAVGPWASKMLKPLGLDLPLQCERINVCYWREKAAGLYTDFPCFMHYTPKLKHEIYGFPAHEYPGLMKVCYHAGAPISSPEDRDLCKNKADIKYISDYIKQYMPGLNNEPAVVETCIYTVTPDRIPIIGTHPDYKNMAFVCGLSGEGFKLAPAIGKVMCELVTGQPLSHDIGPFNPDRFNPQTSSKTGNEKPIAPQSKL